MKKLSTYIILCLFSLHFAYSQEGVITFGLQYKPILPFKILNVSDSELEGAGLAGTISPTLGHNFGAIIRRGFTKNISLEAGLNYNLRNFKVNTTLDDTLDGELNFGVVTYEIPIQALVYVRLSDQFYMNVATGFSMNFRASDIGTFSEDKNFSALGRIQILNLAYVANIGFEYRTKKSGYFYLGASLTNPFRPLGLVQVKSEVEFNSKTALADLSGNYISIDLRYFFHENKQKRAK